MSSSKKVSVFEQGQLFYLFCQTDLLISRPPFSSDLLVRVRYANPLPPPPCPPKLLILPTDLGRFASFSDSAAIARGQPLPMMVDGECGMAVDLLDWTGAWEGDFGGAFLTPPVLQPAVPGASRWGLAAADLDGHRTAYGVELTVLLHSRN